MVHACLGVSVCVFVVVVVVRVVLVAVWGGNRLGVGGHLFSCISRMGSE